MKVCFPVEENKGLDSIVYNHFGSAPLFVNVDADTLAVEVLQNSDQHHDHGMCHPLQALAGHEIDIVVLGGIGAGALAKLNAAGIAVYRSAAPTVKENVEMVKQKRLSLMSGTCGGHGHGGGCGH